VVLYYHLLVCLDLQHSMGPYFLFRSRIRLVTRHYTAQQIYDQDPRPTIGTMVQLSRQRTAHQSSCKRLSSLQTIIGTVVLLLAFQHWQSQPFYEEDQSQLLRFAQQEPQEMPIQVSHTTSPVIVADTTVGSAIRRSVSTLRTPSDSSEIHPDFLLAYEQSYGFFDDIPDNIWKDYYQKRARAAEHYRIPMSPNSRMGWTSHWLFFNVDP